MKAFMKKFWKWITAATVVLVALGLWFFGIIDFGRDRMEAVEAGVATNASDIASVASSLAQVGGSLAQVGGRVDAVETELAQRPTANTVVTAITSYTQPINDRVTANTTEIAALDARLDVLEGSGDNGAVRLGAYNADRTALEATMANFVTNDEIAPLQAQLQAINGVTAEECLAALDVQTQSVAAAQCNETQIVSPIEGCTCRVQPNGDASCEGSGGLTADLERETNRRRYADRQLRDALAALEAASAPAPAANPAPTAAAPTTGVRVYQDVARR